MSFNMQFPALLIQISLKIMLRKTGNPMWEKEDPAEFLVNPHSLEFNSEIEKALYPHRKVLAQLINSPNEVDDALVPAKAWLNSLKKQPRIIHWTGGLIPNDLARINDYFFHCILKISQEHLLDWATGLTMSHARTLVVAYRHRVLFLQDEECPPMSESQSVSCFAFKKAWERLVDFMGCTTDALVLLEKRMFDTSEDAGIAGNHQWGLDIGMHQDNWYPWNSPGPEEEKETHEGNQSEIEVGPEFDQEELAKWHRTELEKEEAREQTQRAMRPRPTLLKKGMRKCRTVSEIPADSVELRPTYDSEEYQPPAKCTRCKLKDGDSTS
ncbi:hypothetical protein EV421DRAFT_2000250 [Armillaria borealis]|uniref:Uncharacterized protein n=1 Tax=Armillaria borealis TaxID=47425 RepID=A0AA39IY92_9AGAR|nr:hypothetical protein EV421DRAFT_2000250 [Armillaria borealis]